MTVLFRVHEPFQSKQKREISLRIQLVLSIYKYWSREMERHRISRILKEIVWASVEGTCANFKFYSIICVEVWIHLLNFNSWVNGWGKTILQSDSWIHWKAFSKIYRTLKFDFVSSLFFRYSVLKKWTKLNLCGFSEKGKEEKPRKEIRNNTQ